MYDYALIVHSVEFHRGFKRPWTEHVFDVSDFTDMVALVAGVSGKAVEWAEDLKAAVASTLAGEKRVEFEADVARLEAASALFQDTPDDLGELL